MEALSYGLIAGLTFVAIVYSARWIIGVRSAIRLRPVSLSRIFVALVFRPGPWLVASVLAALWYAWPTDGFPIALSAVLTVVIALFWLYWIDVGKTRHPGRKAKPGSGDAA